MKRVEHMNVTQVTRESRAEAGRILNASELRLYLYLLDMAEVVEESSFPLNRWDFVSCYGLGIASYHRALNGLQEKGYLRKKNGSTFLFDAVGGLSR